MLTYTPLTPQQYVDQLVGLISTVEGFLPSATQPPKDPNWTIGFGYTFGRSDNVALWQAAGVALSPADLALLTQIDAAPAAQKNALAAGFSRTILLAEARALLKQTYSQYEGPANTLAMPLSRERVALVSVTYNRGPGAVARSMQGFTNAIASSDRAEAWFQLRYLSWGTDTGNEAGLRKRRLLEAQVFGLYDGPAMASIAEAQQAFASLSKHRTEVLRLESLWGVPPDGSAVVRNLIAEANSSPAYRAISTVDNLFDALLPARDAFIAWVNTQLPAEEAPLVAAAWNPAAIAYNSPSLPQPMLDARSLDGKGNGMDKNLLVGNDTPDYLIGGAGNDVLIGGLGDDFLQGGIGDDVLYGGTGDDTYVINLGDGVQHDRIVDSDGRGKIIVIGVDGNVFNTTILQRQNNASNVWIDPSAQSPVTISHNSPWRMTLPNGSVIELGEDFNPAAFGITLNDKPEDPTNTFTGDYIKKLDIGDPTRYVFDAYGNYASDGAQVVASDLLHGTDGNDVLNGLGGNDALDGWGGDDLIEGGDGDDLVFGGYGADKIDGGAGRDFIYGSGLGALNYPNQTIDPQPQAQGTIYTQGFYWLTYDAGTDGNGFQTYGIAGASGGTLNGDAGNVIDGGTGDDWIRAGSGDDIVHGGADGDDIVGLAGEDVLFGDEGDDAIWGDGIDVAGYLESVPGGQHGDDVLVGGHGNDTLVGQGGDDELYGSEDDDLIRGDDSDLQSTPLANHGDDYLDGGDGDDTVIGGGRDDVLFGGLGDDAMHGDDAPDQVDGAYHGDDYLDGEEGADQLAGGGGRDTLFGGIGNDSLWGDDPGLDAQYQLEDYLDGEEGDDYLEGGGAADQLIGGAGADTLLGGDGDDELYGDAGLDVLAGGAGTDYLDGGEDDDTLQGGEGDDELFGDAGKDLLYGQAGDDYLDGEDDDDQLQGGDGNDSLFGGAGSDLLTGDAGNDELSGEDGNDEIQGGEGNDTLDGGQGNDSLFGQGGDDQLDAGSGNDALVAGEGQDIVVGGDGDDALWGDAGDDVLDGAAGSDQLQGGDGNDMLDGGTDNDVLFGENGDDLLDGGDGSDTMVGGAGNDTLIGGSGFDVLQGGDGDDTYVFATGDSASLALAETINDTLGLNHLRLDDGVSIGSVKVESSPFQGYWIVNTGTSWVLANGLLSGALADVSVGGTTYAWQEFLGKTFYYSVYKNTSLANQQLVGGRLDDNLTGYGGGSTFWGGAGTDALTGDGGGNTYVFGRGDGHDTVTEYRRTQPTSTVRFGAGITVDDLMLSSYAGQLRIDLRGSAGDRLAITGFYAPQPLASIGIAQFAFADGQTLSYADVVGRGITIGGSDGADTLAGSAISDTLDGGAGNDLMSGKQGADTYLFGRGAGNDVLADQDTQAGTGDRLLFKAGIAPQDLLASRYQNDLVLRIAGSSDSVRLKDYFVAGSGDRVELIEFNDGSQLTSSDVDAMIALHAGGPIIGQDGPDVLYGTAAGDLIDGAAGADLLYGDAGNDTLVGGMGNDTMFGGAGSDTYNIGAGSSSDVIDERPGGDTTGIDTLHFGDGVTKSSVTFIANGSSLVALDDSRGVSVTVAGQFDTAGAANQIERFEFSDGVVMSAQDVKTAAQSGSPMSDLIRGLNVDDDMTAGYGHDTMYGGAGNDRLHGDQGNDSINGEAGNDSLYGDAGDDTLAGGDGNDLLDGGSGRDRLDAGAGDDIYALGLGSANDIIVQDAAGADVVQLAGGITSANVTLYRVSSPPAADIAFNGDSLVIQLAGGSDQLWIANYFASASPGYIERIQFADGSSWDYAAVTARLASSGGTSNTLTGTNKADTFAIDHWNDLLPATLTSGDKAQSSTSYRLPAAALASFTFTGTLNLFAVPSEQYYTTYGNVGDNTFDSNTRADSALYSGGKGNDAYITRNPNDDVTTGMDPASLGTKPVELAGEGNDTYLSGYWSARLAANVENLVLLTPNAVSNYNLTFYGYGANDFTHKLIGNALDNTIDTTPYEDQLSSQWWYSYRNNPLTGAGTFRLDGGAGADTLIGGRGDDIYVIDNAADTVVETGYSKTGYDWSSDTVETIFSTAVAQFAHIENITLAGTAAVSATGDALANRLDGSLNTAVNQLIGGAGDDTYVVGAGDVVLEQPGEGIDTVVVASSSGTLARVSDYANTENLRLAAGAGALNAQGDVNANTLIGSLGNNRLNGLEGNDAVFDQGQNDTLTYYGRMAAADNDTLEGGAGNDSLTSYGGDDVLDGGAGDDSLIVYGRYAPYSGVQSATVTMRLGIGDGHDALGRSNASVNAYVLDFKPGVTIADVRLSAVDSTLTVSLPDGTSIALYGAMEWGSTTQMASDYILSMSFADGIRLGAAQLQAILRTTDHSTPTELADVLLGAATADTINALGGDDLVDGSNGDDLLDGGSGNDALYGGAGADTVSGSSGNDVLGGGNGADVYRFSRGFGVDSIDDLLGTGTGVDDGAVDVVEFDGTIAVADVAVYRQVSGSTPVGLVLAVPASGDTVDLNRSYNAGTAGAIERVRFGNGTQWDLSAMKSRIGGEVGGDAGDTLNGTALADVLDGRGGGDTMTGLAGDDTYYVDSSSDQVIEASNAGTDTVVSTIDLTLAANVERLRLAGTASLRGTGNALNNLLTGNVGANRLDGSSGSDTMAGGLGDDTYAVDAAGDVITEQSGEGVDTVESMVSYTLGANVENLILLGTGKISGTGNALDNRIVGTSAVNTLTGGAGNDRLDGGAAADSMTGGTGDDTYVVDNGSDKTIESTSGGYDTVESGVSWTLSAEVERLFLTGGNVVNGTGNAANNWLIGNDAVNTLDGGAGSDILIGRGGNDILQDVSGNNAFDGGAGNDTLKGGVGSDLLCAGIDADTLTLGGGADIIGFNRGDGTDTVVAPVSGAGSGERNDTISVGKASWSELALAREGSDLLLKLTSTGDSLRLKDWYLATTNQTVVRLQWVVDSSVEYASGGADVLRNSRICVLDFSKLLASFDAAKAANPALGDWHPTDSTLTAARNLSSDTSAYGGVLAYRYAQDGLLSNVASGAAADPLAAAGFGSTLQAIAASAGPAGGVMALQEPIAESAPDAGIESMRTTVDSTQIESTGLMTLPEDVASGANIVPATVDAFVAVAAVSAAADSAGRTVDSAGMIQPSLAPPALRGNSAEMAAAGDVKLSTPTIGSSANPGASWSPMDASATSAVAARAAGAAGSHGTRSPAPTASSGGFTGETGAALVSPAGSNDEDRSADGSSAVGPVPPAAELFPVSSLLRAIGSGERPELERATRPAVRLAMVDIRGQWQSVDAWAALERSADAGMFEGVAAVAAELDLAIRFAPQGAPNAALLNAGAKRFDAVEQFDLAHLG